jgi:hypothetical protein
MLPASWRLRSNHELARSIDGRLRFLRVGLVSLCIDCDRLGTGKLEPSQESARATASIYICSCFRFEREC